MNNCWNLVRTKYAHYELKFRSKKDIAFPPKTSPELSSSGGKCLSQGQRKTEIALSSHLQQKSRLHLQRAGVVRWRRFTSSSTSETETSSQPKKKASLSKEQRAAAVESFVKELNGLQVDDTHLFARPAPVFPPEVIQVLWSHPDGRSHLRNEIRNLLQNLDESLAHKAEVTDMMNKYYRLD